ncbi:hypothetical protein Hamer_G003984 [Homarus americanus]|uniref:Uncharacterized protein n=1 Tax=Homarus americanus TaxID=6706 RepID=A0A8J5NCF6_HOMAM|nr:hypothetical protein Hamer_G003984 [Homarus americanus]
MFTSELFEEAKLMGISEPTEIRNYVLTRQADECQDRAKEREERAKEREEQEKLFLYELEVWRIRSEEAEKARKHELAITTIKQDSPAQTPAVSSLPRVKLPMFDEQQTIEPYIQRFEDLAELYSFSESMKCLHFMSLVEGKPLEILHRISSNEKTYNMIKSALLKADGVKVDQARSQFPGATMQDKRTATQFAVRLTAYSNQWISMDETPDTKRE